MERYWLFIDSKVQGPLDVPALRKVPGFTLLTQVCGESEQQWRMADDVVEIKSYFVSPPRISSMPLDGNAALKVQAAPAPMAAPALVEELPPLDLKAVPAAVRTDKPGGAPPPSGAEGLAKAPASGALRQVCSLCGYKNPRDVAVCMKCGGALEVPVAAPADAAASEATTVNIERPPETTKMDVAPADELPPPTLQDSMALDIPVARIVGVLAGVAVLAALALVGQRSWKKHHALKVHKVAVVPAAAPAPVAETPRVTRPRTARRSAPRVPKVAPAELPGVTSDDQSTPTSETPPATDTTQATPSDGDPSYHVLSEATPLKHRQSAPIDSPYAKKRRADRGLWSNQEDQAIQQVQQFRIYGGQRTVQRNAEILMQILRDREYNTGFETGRRPFFYNDSDWSAQPKDGPIYEVHLTFSGGRELDGSPRKPLRFAFDTDLERGTVEPGGVDQIRSNTLHAFFDESRIPPDDRRAIAKDTEELVLAGQPDASPLALDTIVRHFVGTYGSDALKRVARAFGLDLVTKKVTHDPTLTSDRIPSTTPEAASAPAAAPASESSFKSLGASFNTAPAPVQKSRKAVSAPTPSAAPVASPKKARVDGTRMGSIDYQLTRGEGRERRIEVHVPSKASVGALWDALTGYERYKQFVPDILESEREGQDGNAVIVHTVSLTRFLFFVFKINLHLRVLEHPTEHALEFERIAGEFENFRGSVQIAVDPSTRQPMMTFRATVAPKGKIPDWVFRDMAQRLVVPILDAIRARAEG